MKSLSWKQVIIHFLHSPCLLCICSTILYTSACAPDIILLAIWYILFTEFKCRALLWILKEGGKKKHYYISKINIPLVLFRDITCFGTSLNFLVLAEWLIWHHCLIQKIAYVPILNNSLHSFICQIFIYVRIENPYSCNNWWHVFLWYDKHYNSIKYLCKFWLRKVSVTGQNKWEYGNTPRHMN